MSDFDEMVAGSGDPTVRVIAAGLRVFGGRFELLRMLGRGGMGVVWLARDGRLTVDAEY